MSIFLGCCSHSEWRTIYSKSPQESRLFLLIFDIFWRCLHCQKEHVACSKRQSWCGSTIQCSRRPNSTSSAKLLSPCLSEAFDIPHLTHFTQFRNYPNLFPHLSISWETLSSSLAPHLIGNLDTFSSLAPSWPLDRSNRFEAVQSWYVSFVLYPLMLAIHVASMQLLDTRFTLFLHTHTHQGRTWHIK